jgi:hypothetical protein
MQTDALRICEMSLPPWSRLKVAAGVHGVCWDQVLVKKHAEDEGLDKIFTVRRASIA